MSPKLEEMFYSFSPDAAIVMLLAVLILQALVEKGILTKEEVSDISNKAGEIVGEVAECMGDLTAEEKELDASHTL
jgi:hypothetical protein